VVVNLAEKCILFILELILTGYQPTGSWIGQQAGSNGAGWNLEPASNAEAWLTGAGPPQCRKAWKVKIWVL
jgi:hypothetical protein